MEKPTLNKKGNYKKKVPQEMGKKLRKFWLLSEGIIELAKNKKTTKILQSEIMVAPFETIDLVVHKVSLSQGS